MRYAIIAIVTLFMLSCSGHGQKTQANGIGNNCFPDISNCDVSGSYGLAAVDVAPLYIYSSQLLVSQAGPSPSALSISPNLTFYLASNSYIFRSIGAGTWDGDSVKATIHGKLRSNATGNPAVGGFSITLKLEAKTKTLTTAYYYNTTLQRIPLPALDGVMVLSDTANVMFPTLNTAAKVMFTQF